MKDEGEGLEEVGAVGEMVLDSEQLKWTLLLYHF